MQPKKFYLKAFSFLVIAALLVACGSPAAAPTATPLPPTPASIPPTATPVPPTPEPAPVAEEPAAAAAEPEAPHGIRFDAPEYAIDGPYAVGVRYFTIPAAAENDRDLTVSVWYPAQQTDSAPGEMVYEQHFAPGEIPAFTVLGHAQLDAPPDASGAPYPLVVYSHATWSFAQEIPYFTEHLASHGFVVISADHEDNWSTAFNQATVQAMIRRPGEVTRQIDYAESLTAAGGDLAGMIDATGVGVAGWSMGGETALVVAGARWDLDGLRAWCEDSPETLDLSVDACVEQFTTLVGLKETPQGLWPSMVDERVRAVVPLSGYTLAFGSNGMEEVDVPVMAMAGSGAMAASPVWDVEAPYDALNTEHKAKVVFDHGEYLFFFSSCADSPSIVELGFPMFCTDPVWDVDRTHDLINHFATAFLLAELKGDSAAAAALAPESVDFPGIEYESLGYGAAASTALEDATVAKIDAIVQTAMTDYPTPGFEMCIVKDDQVVYNKGFGLADVASDRPMTPQSVSIQASISKSLTAMAVMQLVEQGKVDLDKPVTSYLPYFTMADPRYEEITVRMLLSHLAGLPDVPMPWDVPLDPVIDPLEQAVRNLSDQQLISAPGEAWNYSNWGYLVLGDIIAKVSGEPFASYMQQNLLEPMGMVNSTFVAAEVDPELQVTGYISAEDGSPAAIEVANDPRDLPADGLWSNCEDMTRWAWFMLNKGELNGTRVLQPESIDAMWTSEAGTFWPDVVGPWYGPYVGEYGLGWYVGEKAGHRLAGHAGANDGVNTHIQFAPDDGLAVIAIDNWLKPDPDWYPAGFAAFDVMDLLLGLQPEEESAATLDDATTAKIETLVEEIMASGQVPGAAVGIVKDGELVYAKGFGVTELGGDQAVTADSIFHMGSVAKTPTALAIMQLVEAGKIDLDAPLTEYLPYFTLADPDLGEVTIRRLLSHTAGMPDPIDWLAEYQDENLRSDDAAMDDYVRSLGDQSLTYQPGEDWAYSNTGFDILGDVVATVSGQSFEDYLQANVLSPLGMANSSYLLSDVDPAKLAAPHMYDEDGNAKTLDFYPYTRAHAPSGAFYSSIHDMARFAIANMNQGELDGTRVLPASAYEEMWAPQAASPWAEMFGPTVSNYALGWWVGEFNGHPIIGNYGTEFGFQSHFGMFLEDDMAVIAMVNLFDPEAGTFYAYDIGNAVSEALLGVETEPAAQP